MSDKNQQVIQANISVHTTVAAHYEKTEPHFREENVTLVEARLRKAVDETAAKSLLDLGCGTGFIIGLAKKQVARVVGVDVTRAMLDRVDTSGPAKIELHEHDTGTFAAAPGAFDVVTAYSFLHHLYDVRPTLATAYTALRKGGVFYADLDPNFYFWQAVSQLDPAGAYDPMVRRELDAVVSKNEQMTRDYGIPGAVFDDAEYGKSTTGGFREETLREQLADAGFSRIELSYYWFLGQAALVNDASRPRAERLARAQETDALLQRALPLSRVLYKYLGFVARK